MITFPITGQAVQWQDPDFREPDRKVIGFVVGTGIYQGDLMVRVVADRSAEARSESWPLGEIEPASYEDTMAILGDLGVNEEGWINAVRYEMTGQSDPDLGVELSGYLATITRDPDDNVVFSPMPPHRAVCANTLSMAVTDRPWLERSPGSGPAQSPVIEIADRLQDLAEDLAQTSSAAVDEISDLLSTVEAVVVEARIELVPLRKYTVMSPRGMRGPTYEARSPKDAEEQAKAHGYEILDVQDDILVTGEDHVYTADADGTRVCTTHNVVVYGDEQCAEI